MFGHEPAVVLHQLLGEGFAAHVLASVYLLFLPISPVSLIVYLVWSRNISYGYWYATAQCLAWALGTVSYYVLPDAGPELRVPVALRRPRPDRRHVAAAVAELLAVRRGVRAAHHRLDPERRGLRLAARRASS